MPSPRGTRRWRNAPAYRSIPCRPRSKGPSRRSRLTPSAPSTRSAATGLATYADRAGHFERSETMLETIVVLLVVLWLLGMVSSYTLGGFIHLLLVLAIAVMLVRIIQGRRPV